MAASIDCAARELDGKCPVLVSPRERAAVKDKQGPALVGLLTPDENVVVPEPMSKVNLLLRCCRTGRGWDPVK